MGKEKLEDIVFIIKEELVNDASEYIVFSGNKKEDTKNKIASFVRFTNAVDYINYLLFRAKRKQNHETIISMLPKESYKKEEIYASDIDIDEFLKEASEKPAAGTLGMGSSQEDEIMKISNHNSTDEGDIMDLFGPAIEDYGGREDAFWDSYNTD